MDAAGILAGGEQAGEGGGAILREDDASHHVMRGRDDLDETAREIEAAIGAALDHSPEQATDIGGAEMAHVDPQPAIRRRVAAADFGHHRSADDVARRALQAWIIIVHEAPAVAAEEVTAGAAQTLLEHRPGHPRVGAGEEAGGVELHHLHVAQGQARLQRHGHAVAGFIARGRVIFVHRRAAAGGEQNGARLDEDELAAAHVDHQHARQGIAVAGANERNGAMLFETLDVARPHLLGEPVDDLDAGEVALVDGAVEGLAGEGLLMDRAVGVAIEEAAELALELADTKLRHGDEGPGEILLVEKLAALDRVHEMPLGGIARGQRDVVAALHHASAAAFTEQALDGDGDRKVRRRLLGVKRGEEPSAAGAEDEDVGGEALHHSVAVQFPLPLREREGPVAKRREGEGAGAASSQFGTSPLTPALSRKGRGKRSEG